MAFNKVVFPAPLPPSSTTMAPRETFNANSVQHPDAPVADVEIADFQQRAHAVRSTAERPT